MNRMVGGRGGRFFRLLGLRVALTPVLLGISTGLAVVDLLLLLLWDDGDTRTDQAGFPIGRVEHHVSRRIRRVALREEGTLRLRQGLLVYFPLGFSPLVFGGLAEGQVARVLFSQLDLLDRQGPAMDRAGLFGDLAV